MSSILAEQRPISTLLHLQLCPMLPPPSSSSCNCILLSTSPSPDLFSRCSLVVLFLCDHVAYTDCTLSNDVLAPSWRVPKPSPLLLPYLVQPLDVLCRQLTLLRQPALSIHTPRCFTDSKQRHVLGSKWKKISLNSLNSHKFIFQIWNFITICHLIFEHSCQHTPKDASTHAAGVLEASLAALVTQTHNH